MAPTADGKTSIRPHWRDWTRGGVVLEAIGTPMVQFGSVTPRNDAGFRSDSPTSEMPHGQALRDLRQRAAIRTPRQPRQEPGQPEVHAQPPDGPGDSGGEARARAHLHPLPADLLRLGPTRRGR